MPPPPPKPILVRVSPRFVSDKLESANIEDRIDVYEDRVRGWLFRPIAELLRTRDFAFAALSLTLDYFEGWAQYRFGEDSKGHSKDFFVRALQEVFPIVLKREVIERAVDTAEVFDTLYAQARCGAFHDGITRQRIVLRRPGAPISVSVQKVTGVFSGIAIDPVAFFEDVQAHFDRYVSELRDPAKAELRTNFAKTWELKRAGGPLHFPADS
jgi:hypothetical protein